MLFLGIDVGTTAIKAAVVDQNGNTLSKGAFEYALSCPVNNHVEQNAEDWWTGVCAATKAAIAALPQPEAIAGIGLSAQASTLVMVDKDGYPLAPAITWMDLRAGEESQLLAQHVGGKQALYRKTGFPPSPAADASKLMWLRKNQSALFEKAAYFLTPSSFVNYKLCGRFITDPSNTAIQRLLNLESQQYDPEILAVVGVEQERLPEILPPGALVGHLTPEAAQAMGLDAHVPVYNGVHDQYAAALGAGAVNTGDMLLATGTAWVVLGVADRPVFTPSYVWPGVHPAQGKFGAMASLISAGSTANWCQKIIGDDLRHMDEMAATRTESAANLFFYPYLRGASFPRLLLNSRGTLVGLDLCHDKYDIALAAMEGVAFEAALALEDYAANGLSIRRLMMTGGASKSRLWSELVGYITGCEIFQAKEPDAGCVGAAMLAAVGTGAYADYTEAAAAMCTSVLLPLPEKEKFDFYREKLGRYRAMLDQAHSFYEA